MIRFHISLALLLLLLIPEELVKAFAASPSCTSRDAKTTTESRRRNADWILHLARRSLLRPSRRPPPQTSISCLPRNLLESYAAAAVSYSRLASTKSDETNGARSRTDGMEEDDQKKEPVLKAFLSGEYSAFAQLLSLNPGIWEMLDKDSVTATVFCPTNAAFDRLGEKRLRQLRDVRNEETVQKIGQYHVVLGDAVSAARLRTEDWTAPLPTTTTAAVGQQPSPPRPTKVSGLITMAGEVPVGRPKQPKSGPVLQFLERILGAVSQPLPAQSDSTTAAATNDQGISNSNNNKNEICIGPAGRLRKSYKLDNGKYYVHEVDGFICPDILWRYFDQLRIPGF